MSNFLHTYPQSAAQAGWQAEKLARLHFLECGYSVSSGRDGSDLVATTQDGEVIKIEVKGSRQGADKKWRFTLYKEGHTDARKSDMIMFVQFHVSGLVALYLAPVAFFGGAHQAVIGTHAEKYRGKLRPFRIMEL